jgi:hypothetical protein
MTETTRGIRRARKIRKKRKRKRKRNTRNIRGAAPTTTPTRIKGKDTQRRTRRPREGVAVMEEKGVAEALHELNDLGSLHGLDHYRVVCQTMPADDNLY